MKTNKYMLSKATFSSGSGMPIAFALNLAILPLFAESLLSHPFQAAIMIGVIYTTVSIFRLFLIDWIEDRYGLNIRPDHLLKKLFNRNTKTVHLTAIDELSPWEAEEDKTLPLGFPRGTLPQGWKD